MENVILSSIPLNELEGKLRDIVKEELKIHLPQENEEKLISPEETRKIFVPPISKVTLINWTKASKLNSYRIGGRVYYKRSEVINASTSLQKYGRK